MKKYKLNREIEKIINDPDLHWWHKCKLLSNIKVDSRPGCYEASVTIDDFFKNVPCQDRFTSAYVRPYYDRWWPMYNSGYPKDQTIGRNPRGITLIRKPPNNDRVERYFRNKFPEAFIEFAEIKKTISGMGRTHAWAWQHLFEHEFRFLTWECFGLSYYPDEKARLRAKFKKIPRCAQKRIRALDLRFEKASADYKLLYQKSKLPPRYLYNEVSLAQLQNEHKNHTYAIFKGKYIHTETVLHYDNSDVHHGLGKLVKTDRAVIIRDGRGVIYRKELKSYAGNFIINSLIHFFGISNKSIDVPISLRPIQLYKGFNVIAFTKIGKDGFQTFERIFDDEHWDYCVFKDGITFHGLSIDACMSGWNKKHKAKLKDRIKNYDLKFALGLGFCRTGIASFCSLNGLDIEKSYSKKEILSCINKRINENKRTFGYELKKAGIF